MAKAGTKNSPNAAQNLWEMLEDDSSATLSDFDDAIGETDCEYGCVVEPDGYCPHGYRSAALSLGII